MDDLRARPIDLANLVTYQQGSVVSREIARKGAGTVTVFAFDEGQGLSEHTAPFDAIVQIIDGTADITVGGTLHRIGNGGLIIMPADIPHALMAVTPFKMLLIMLRA